MIKEQKYRLVSVKRSFFITPSNIDRVTRIKNGSHFIVSFKDSKSKSLNIHRKVFKRLLEDFPNIMVV